MFHRNSSSSLTRTTLYRVAVGVTLIITLSGAVTYILLAREIERHVVERLSDYAGQQAKYHEAHFAQAADFHNVVKQEFLRRYGSLPANFENRFDRLMMRYPDGAIRNRPAYSDVVHYSTGWIHKDLQITPAFKRLWMLMFDLSEQYAKLVTTQFLNLYFFTSQPGMSNMGYDRQDPGKPITWAFNVPADYPQNDYEPYYIGDESHNPQRQTVWTATYFEPGLDQFVVSVATPVYVQDRLIATIGSSIFIDDLVASILKSEIEGATHTVFRHDGRLVADPEHVPPRMENRSVLYIDKLGDSRLTKLLQSARDTASFPVSGHDKNNDFYFAISRLESPGWYFASTLPGRLVRDQAFRSAQWVFWIGLGSLGLLLSVLALILRQRVAQPLGRLLTATQTVSAGETHLVESISTDDEIGRLARAFNEMVLKIQGRDAALRIEKAELQRALQTLKSTEERFRSLIEHAADVICVIDAQGIISYLSPSVAQVLDQLPENYLGKPLIGIVHPDDAKLVEQAYRATLQRTGAPPQRIEFRLRHKLDIWREFEATSTDQLDNPAVQGIVINARDITEANEAQEEIARQREILYQREKLAAMGSLLAGVAHELNNPLSIVVGRAIMLEEESSNTVILSAAQSIRAAAERCARIVKTFLAMARQNHPRQSAIQINRVIEDSLDILSYTLRTGGIEIERDLANGLPNISADADQLPQVFINLIVNAQQALSDRPEPRRIRVISGYDPSTKEIRVEVADNGPGVPEAIRSRIFDPYFTTKPAGSGTGIGLAVSQGIVEAQGGSLTVTCPPEGGAIFVVRLPVLNGIDVKCQSESESHNSIAPHKDRKHILIIDDEPDIAALLADILANGQRSIDVAVSGPEALGLIARQGCYHAILTDLRMPGMDGVSLYREIEKRWPDLARKVVFVTGDALSPQVQNLLLETGCAIIEKPFAPSEVRQKLDLLLTTDHIQ